MLYVSIELFHQIPSNFYGFCNRFGDFYKSITNGPTDQRTDGPTDGHTLLESWLTTKKQGKRAVLFRERKEGVDNVNVAFVLLLFPLLIQIGPSFLSICFLFHPVLLFICPQFQ